MGEIARMMMGGGVEGVHFTSDKYTCWQYGVPPQPHFTCTDSAVSFTTHSATELRASSTGVMYSSISVVNGVVVFEGRFTPSANNQYGYYSLAGSIYYGYVTNIQDDIYFDWYSTKIANNVSPPYGAVYEGLVFSKNASRYPDGDSAPDGYYYRKKTGTELNLNYW